MLLYATQRTQGRPGRGLWTGATAAEGAPPPRLIKSWPQFTARARAAASGGHITAGCRRHSYLLHSL